MSIAPQQFPYSLRAPQHGSSSLAPMLPATLIAQQTISVSGLVDSGAAINVLPFSLGVQLGFDWSSETTQVQLTGNMGGVDARAIVLTAVVAKYAPVRLAFAWAKSDSLSVIFGQMNFLLEFDVCFFGSRRMFEVRPRP